ncbi:flagellar protein FlaG [Hahella ganghwensis]|uniref:flagellar protein FlaG n=1 Tax=Hahella ganghwensis TaxID=286420 RepID=UPI0003A80D26|nr:flagellar protein FlaG [Hahella ganghwensis]
MNDLKVNDLNVAGAAKAAVPVVRSGTSSPLTEPGAKSGGGAASPVATSPKQAVKSDSVSAAEGVSQKESQKGENKQGQEQLKEAVSKLNDYIQSVQRDLQFELDDDSGKTVVRVLDRQTQEVVRQIPDEVALKLARNLLQDEPISLFDAKA